jgi:cobyrinic acid a,c-diamide synthase
MHTPAVVIAGTHSGVGKTTISVALMAALKRRGMRVQPFKVGPDFIDPMLHTWAAERYSRNLDGWMLSGNTNIETFSRASKDADISIIEGVMGLFDGRDALTESGSTAEMAKLLGVPVVLVVDASAMARSAAAIVCGFESFDAELNVAGIIFNNVGGAGHFEYLRQAVEATCRARVLGWLPSYESIKLPERHLGLVVSDNLLDAVRLDEMIRWIGKLDLNALIELAGEHSQPQSSTVLEQNDYKTTALAQKTRIGVARDQAFCFYYQDNLDRLIDLGAELVEFSPTTDRLLPEGIHGLYLGGGYPELYAAELSANESMRNDIARFAERGLPMYAECGGFMYLTEAIVTTDERTYPMVGLFPTRARMKSRLAALGYVEVEGVNDSPWLHQNEHARGHEFRYSTIDEMPAHIARQYRVKTRDGVRAEGFVAGSTLASYIHLHWASCHEIASRFVAACANVSSLSQRERKERATNAHS